MISREALIGYERRKRMEVAGIVTVFGVMTAALVERYEKSLSRSVLITIVGLETHT